jgi:hypothetical protein
MLIRAFVVSALLPRVLAGCTSKLLAFPHSLPSSLSPLLIFPFSRLRETFTCDDASERVRWLEKLGTAGWNIGAEQPSPAVPSSDAAATSTPKLAVSSAQIGGKFSAGPSTPQQVRPRTPPISPVVML